MKYNRIHIHRPHVKNAPTKAIDILDKCVKLGDISYPKRY